MPNTKTITVYIDSDPLTLGPKANKEEVDEYADNLASHLVVQFPGNAFEVE